MDTNLSAAHRLAARKYQRGGILTRSVIGMMPTTCQVRKARVTQKNYNYVKYALSAAALLQGELR